MLRWHSMVAAALLLSATSAHAGEKSVTIDTQRLIGIATMMPNGTIVLDLHGDRESNYAMGHFEYPPTHKDYEAILKHLGGLVPGQKKGVRPWP